MSDPKILGVRFSAIGDCIMTAYAVTALRNLFPQSQISWAAQERCIPVIDQTLSDPIIADYNAWKKRRWSPTTWKQQLAVYSRLREQHFDIGFDFQGHSKTALCLRLAKPKTRLASRATDALAAKLNQLVDCQAGSAHEVEVAFKLVQHAFPAAQLPISPILPNPPKLDQTFQVTIQTGAGHPDKKVNHEVWKQVAANLIKNNFSTAIIGAPNDPSFELDGLTNLVGKLSLLDSMALVKHSQLHIASDTGTGHIAAAYATPVLSVFGPTNPDIYRPYHPSAKVLKYSQNPADVPTNEIIETAIHMLQSNQKVGSL